MKRLTTLLACTAVLLGIAAPAQAATLLASDQAGNLFSVDTVTGVGTLIGQETQFPLSTEIEFETATGILYSEEVNGNLNLHTIDTLTGLSTGFVPHACCAFTGLEFVGPILYGTNIQGPQGPSTLDIIDPLTGLNTPIGPTGLGPITGLAYDPASGIMYGVTGGPTQALLVRLDLLTGIAFPLAPLAEVTGAPVIRVGSIEFGSDGVLYGGMGLNSPVNAGWLFSIDVTTGIINPIGPTGLQGITGLTSPVPDGVLAGTTARFQVTKTFSDGSEGDVDVTLTCNSGLPLEQTFTISGGGPGVTFVVTELPDSGADCAVTESGGHDNYTSVMNAGLGCEWTGVVNGFYGCRILNEANPATYTVTKDWVIQDERLDEVDYSVDISIVCDSDILAVGGSSTNVGSSTTVSLNGEDSVDVLVETLFGPANCSATEDVVQSGVESMGSDECSGAELTAGGSAECVFTNTVFFEGIPTLSQYGMALMALLMLGVGFVGFRRFV